VGQCRDGPGVLGRMLEAMSGPWPATERHLSEAFALGTTRPDLSPAQSHLARTGDGDVALAFAGYLQSTAPRQRTHPAEHCLALYQRHGDLFPRELSGTFAVAVYDQGRQRLLLAADRLATRGLYYCLTEGTVVFGSEVKAILEFPGVSRKINAERVCEFLCIAQVIGPVSHYDHIRQVPSGSIVAVSGGSAQLRRYWTLRFDHENAPAIAEHAARAVEVLRRATRRACAAAAPVGHMLSGGLDSRAVAAAADAPLRCATLHTSEGYEVMTARRVATLLGHRHRFVCVPPEHPMELLEAGPLIGDATHVYHSAQVLTLSDWVREEGIRVMLTGCRLEHNFNSLMPFQVVVRILGRREPLPLMRRLPPEQVPATFVRVRQSAGEETLTRLLKAVGWRELQVNMAERCAGLLAASAEAVSNEYDAYEVIFALANAYAMRDWLNIIAADRLAAAPIVAADTEMIDLLLATPPAYRFNRRMYAHMLPGLHAGLRQVPYTKTGVPTSKNPWREWLSARARGASRRAQRGFRRAVGKPRRNVSRTAWPSPSRAMRECAAWHQTLRAYARESRLADLGVVHGDGVQAMIQEHLDGRRDNMMALGAWLTVEGWLRRYG
jgi:asparagine synthetase B (glutamine-hydrolysing)